MDETLKYFYYHDVVSILVKYLKEVEVLSVNKLGCKIVQEMLFGI